MTEQGASTARPAIWWGGFGLGVSVALMGAKLGVFLMTGSLAVLSDALESIVNIVTSGFALYAVRLAANPRDHDHPYGHGRIEYIAEAIEGAAIGVAGFAILTVTSMSLGGQVDVARPGVGSLLIAGISALAWLGGTVLRRAGERLGAPALAADGAHLQADAFTSAAAFVGLVLVWLTGWQWLDTVTAVVIGCWLLVIGWRLMRRAVGSLMDEADVALLDELATVFEAVRQPGWVAPHLTRVHRLGQDIHVDMHLVFPRFWSLEQAHEASVLLDEAGRRRFGPRTDLMVHMEPCTDRSCSYCDLASCPIRASAFVRRRVWTGRYMAQQRRPGPDEPA